MKKKARSKWKVALWLLIAIAFVCIVLAPLNRNVPKLQWRVPVHVAMPPLSKITNSMPDLPELPKSLPDMPSLPKIGMPDLDKIESKIQDKVEDIWHEIPPFPYEAEHKKEATEVLSELPEEPPTPPRPPEHGKGARIAIIIDDMGLVPTLSARAVKLPAKVTLAYLPYAPRLQEQTEQAAAAGHDILLHMPMEPMGGENPGPIALLSSQSEEQWRATMEKALSSFDGFIGVNNHMGSKFTANPQGMAVVAQALREKGVFFVDSRTNAKSLAEQAARDAGVKTTGRDVFLDDTQTAANVRAELLRAEKVARQKGSAVAIGHPHAVTLMELEKWLPEAQARGYEIVPVRDLVR